MPKPHAVTATQQRPVSLTALPGLCCAAIGGDRQQAEVFTNAWTLLYTALHMLDTVEDGDDSNAIWASWGPGPAINISTGLLASAGSTLCDLEQGGATRTAAQAIREDFFRTLLQMTAGQHADLTLQEPTLDQCWQIAERKSGPLFALACRAGARLHGASAAQLDLVARFGQHLGLLIQIGDDLDGIWSRDGKASDLLAWPRWTLPVAYAMTVVDATNRERLRGYLQAVGADQTSEAEARSLIIASGAIVYLLAEAHRHQQRARKALLQAVPPSSNQEKLLTLLHSYTPRAPK